MNYYHEHASTYCERTFSLNLKPIYDKVINYIRPGGLVLDVACGSGRDGLYFHNKGFKVEAMDGSLPMVECARQLTDNVFKIDHKDILQCYNLPELRYHLVWCCAGLILMDNSFIRPILTWFTDSLAVGGVMYISFKRGSNAVFCDGMLHSRVSEDFVYNAVKSILHVSLVESWISTGPTSDWINVIIRRDRVS